MADEEWRAVPVPGYEVSSRGRVRSVDRSIACRDRRFRGRLIRPQKGKDGYRRVVLYVGSVPHGRTVHSLVAEAFLGPRPAGQEVRHKDGDQDHNEAVNLEHGTPRREQPRQAPARDRPPAEQGRVPPGPPAEGAEPRSERAPPARLPGLQPGQWLHPLPPRVVRPVEGYIGQILREAHTMTRTRYWYDMEFLENGATIGLISIGIVCDDGRELYLVNSNMPWGRIEKDKWLMANVVPRLAPMVAVTPGGSIKIDYDHPLVQSHDEIARRVLAFVREDGTGPSRDTRELWASHGAYDHVALAQLWGRMVDLPPEIPMHTNDLVTIRQAKPWVKEPLETAAHDALADARWDREFWAALQQELPQRGDHVEAWIKGCRDSMQVPPTRQEADETEGAAQDDLDAAYAALDALLDIYREHADTGVPLHVDLIDPAFETEGQ